MLRGLAWLLVCQLIGEVLVRLVHVEVPGAVVGMLLLFAVLQWRRIGSGADVVRAADVLLRHMQLLFVPAGVGIVAYVSTLRADAVPVVLGLVGSWVLGLVAVGWSATLLGRRSAS